MKYLCVLFALLANAPIVHAEPAPAPRALDAWASESLDRDVKSSALVRELVGVLEETKVIVHIETSPVMPLGIAGYTKFVTSQRGYRYVRITLRRDLSPYDRATVLGHELQHACEIALSPADTKETVRALFQGLGNASTMGHDFFETRAAVQVGRQVALELRHPTDHRAAAGTK